MFPTDAAAGSSPRMRHRGTRALSIPTRQFGQQDTSREFTNAADAQQKITLPSQARIVAIVCAMASSTASSWLVKCEIVTSASD